MYIPVTRLYYGWIVVALAFITMMFVIDTFASSGVLFAALVTEYDWSRATTSLPFSIALVGYAATAWLAGRLFDRYGPRWLFPPIGTICLGVGLLASTYTRSPWQLCLTWGILVGQGFQPRRLCAALGPRGALVPPQSRRGCRSGHQWRQYRQPDDCTRHPVPRRSKWLAFSLYPARLDYYRRSHPDERPVATPLSR